MRQARARDFSWVIGVWLGLVISGFLLTALACAYAWLELRHEQQLRTLGSRVRQVETRLRQTEIQLHLAEQENQKLRSDLVCHQAALAMVGGSLGKTQLVQVARAH